MLSEHVGTCSAFSASVEDGSGFRFALGTAAWSKEFRVQGTLSPKKFSGWFLIPGLVLPGYGSALHVSA